MGVEPSISWIIYRLNAPRTSVIEHYCVNIGILFLDYIVSEFKEQFTAISQTASKLLDLLPSVICKKDAADLKGVVEAYLLLKQLARSLYIGKWFVIR